MQTTTPKRHRLSKNFFLDEYECNCGRADCDAPKYPKFDFVDKLQAVRDACGFALRITSWVRCDFWNRAIGGAKSSKHKTGYAVDIACVNSVKRRKLVYELLKHGFSVVVYSTWIHADLGRPEPILLWGNK